MRLEKLTLQTFFFVVATIPLVFGARHPLIHGLYSFALLLTSGFWLTYNFAEQKNRLLTFNALAPVFILLFIAFTAISLPLPLLNLLSPVRAGYLAELLSLLDLRETGTSLSYYAPGSMYYAVYGLALFLFFYSSSHLLNSQENLQKTLWLITLVGAFEAMYGLMQVTSPALGVLWLPSDIAYERYARGTIIYRNQFAALMNLCWPMSLALGIYLYQPVLKKYMNRKKKNKSLSVVDWTTLFFQKATVPLWGSGLMILALIFSGSRGGICVMLIIGTLFLFLLPVPRRLKSLSVGLLFLFILLYGGSIGFENVLNRFTFFFEGAAFRFNLWISSLAMLKDHILTGIGMGGYEFLSPVYLKNVPAKVWFDRAHNEYVELTIELGLPVMLLLLVWILRGMSGYYGAWVAALGKKGETLAGIEGNAIVAIAAFCGLTGFLLHASVDFIWRLPANMVYAVIVLAILNACGREQQNIT